MASEVTELLIALKAWQKAVKQLKHQGKSTQEKMQQLEQAERQVLDCLEAAAVTTEIDALIQTATDSQALDAGTLRQRLRRDPDALLSTELQTLRPMTTSRTQLDQLVDEYLKTRDRPQPLDDPEQLHKLFAVLSSTVLAEYQQSIAMSRKPKKQRRRDLTLGTLQIAVGIGLLAGNTQIDSAFASASYILGGNALITALQNLVGQFE
jgi:ribosome-binding protein aMBF1 (putative translation factor)